MKKLAVIGASYLQEPLLLKAKEMGIETHCFAWEEGATCKTIADVFYPISIIEKEKILKKCQEIGIDAITSIASDVAVITVCYVAQEMNLISNPYDKVAVTTNKLAMRECFKLSEVDSPRFTLAHSGYDISGFRFPLIVKPTDRSGSRGVMKISAVTELESAITRAKAESFSHEAIIEEYITGAEVSVESVSWQGKHYIITITDKVTTGEPHFVELQHHQPSMLSDEIQNKIKEQTASGLDALGIKYGASHSEFKITDDGQVYVIEIGARMGGDFIGSDLVKLSTGYDFLKGIIEIAFGSFSEPKSIQHKCSGVYFLSKETEHLMPFFVSPKSFPEIVRSEITDNDLRKLQSSSDRSGYLIYQSDKKMLI